MAIVISALRTELLTGSFAQLYSTFVAQGNHNTIADTINRIGVTGSTVVVGTVPVLAMQMAVVPSEYVLLAQPQRDLWAAILITAQGAGLAISNVLIRQQVGQVWSGTTTTRSNLSNLQNRLCSRGETLFGEGVGVDTNSIYVALTQP